MSSINRKVIEYARVKVSPGKYEVMRNSIKIVRTYCSLNGNPNDQWFVGNKFLPLVASMTYHTLSTNKFRIFETQSREITYDLLRYLSEHFGFKTDAVEDGLAIYYLFRIEKHNIFE